MSNRRFLSTLIILLLSLVTLFGGENASIYSNLIPTQLLAINLTGALGSNYLGASGSLTFAPFSITGEANIGLDILYRDVTEAIQWEVEAVNTVTLDAIQFTFDLDSSAQYKEYPLKSSQVPLYYTVGGAVSFMPEVPFGGGALFPVVFLPYVGVGLGKSNQIAPLRNMRSLVDYLKVELSDAELLDVATFYATKEQRLRDLSLDRASARKAFYLELAQLLKDESLALDIAAYEWADPFSRYLQMLRYEDVSYGYNAEIRLAPGIKYLPKVNTQPEISIDMSLRGNYANFIVNESWHYTVAGEAGFQFRSQAPTQTGFKSQAEAILRYYPIAPEWHLMAKIALFYDTLATPNFDITLEVEGNFLIGKRAHAVAGIRSEMLFNQLGLYVGGRYNIR